ncbi:MAG TPA: magnesium chelatase ATPase subunit I [Pyrinomonadaceae bacterium]|jgi:magnesium chelatase subunit D|nr:magnesium chelatase ATPase subunit I [Pyrinomonadaceae bacterium]
MRRAFPFTAIVGQEEMKTALILNVVDPSIGGVLIMGHRGTAKSTAVRALADLLPRIKVVEGCAFNCDPADERNLCSDCAVRAALPSTTAAVSVVELPLGATEDRVCGTIDIERALTQGRKTFDPGLLARANRGFLYIDEVNLLEDHLVDLLLDVAATGRNRVEREGVSVEHPSSFVLVGSGNPEEGELRPQLLDRFGLHAEVVTETYLDNRVDIIERREAYDRDPEGFAEEFEEHQEQLRKRITRARANLRKTTIDRSILSKIAQLCVDLKVDGHRGELTIMRSARALAAFEGRRTVNESHVRRVSAMSLRHRLRRDVLDETAKSEKIEQAADEVLPRPPQPPANEKREAKTQPDTPRKGKPPDGPKQRSAASGGGGKTNTADTLSPPAAESRSVEWQLEERLRAMMPDRGDKSQSHSRRASGSKTANSQVRGRYTRAVSFKSAGARIAIDATLRAMISSFNPRVSSSDLRYKQLKHKRGTLFVFAIDASGSMAANRIARAKSTILKLLKKSYLNRDSVAIVSFHGITANIDLMPSRSILRARRVLDSLRMGGSTPLSAGLASTIELLSLVGDRYGENVVLLFTDGRSNVPLRRGNRPNVRVLRQLKIEMELRELMLELKQLRAQVVVVDTQKEFESSAETRKLAKILQAQFVKLTPAVT